jgi:hypothetical protein
MAHGVGLSLDDEDDSQQECSYCSDLSSEDSYSDGDMPPPWKPLISGAPTSNRRRLETHDSCAVQRPQPTTSVFSLPLPRPRAASMDERGFYALGSGGGGSPGGVSAIRRRLEEWHRDNPSSSSSSLERSDHSDGEVEGNDVDAATARLRRGGNSRSSPWRLCLFLLALTMVVLANQDFLLGPGRNLQEDLRRKEVAFPFRYRSPQRQQPQHPPTDQGSTVGSSATHSKGPKEQYRAAVADLPKFYFPRKQQSLSPGSTDSLPGTTTESATTTNGTPPGKIRHRGSNLSYARGIHPLPVFGGGAGGEALLSQTEQQQILRPAAVDMPPRLKVEQFYLATSNEDEWHEPHSFSTSSNQWNPPHPRKVRRSFSWATWLSGMVLCSMIVEAIWKEYRQYRINSRVGRHQRHQ